MLVILHTAIFQITTKNCQKSRRQKKSQKMLSGFLKKLVCRSKLSFGVRTVAAVGWSKTRRAKQILTAQEFLKKARNEYVWSGAIAVILFQTIYFTSANIPRQNRRPILPIIFEKLAHLFLHHLLHLAEFVSAIVFSSVTLTPAALGDADAALGVEDLRAAPFLRRHCRRSSPPCA